jgi:hypothetical protein
MKPSHRMSFQAKLLGAFFLVILLATAGTSSSTGR